MQNAKYEEQRKLQLVLQKKIWKFSHILSRSVYKDRHKHLIFLIPRQKIFGLRMCNDKSVRTRDSRHETEIEITDTETHIKKNRIKRLIPEKSRSRCIATEALCRSHQHHHKSRISSQ